MYITIMYLCVAYLQIKVFSKFAYPQIRNGVFNELCLPKVSQANYKLRTLLILRIHETQNYLP